MLRYFTGRASNSNARRPTNRDEYASSWGPFRPTYYVFPLRKPITDTEAQKLYNHIRTVAWWLDALPFLTNAGLPFKVGVDDIISAFPVWGDFAGTILSMYQVYLCWVFAVPHSILIRMVVNVVIDMFLGIVPLFGDALDVLFKANLRNLDLLEDWLLKDAPHRIFLMPNREFLPRKSAAREHNADARSKYRNATRTTRMEDTFAPPDLD
ncbi:Transmembrane protein [Ceratobasidium theobromae]|uniref:Transmembrane protein n=1 Tax=Ceratobasidium theobromae TaxID=1582974 RepID=A0A5N5QCQ8_9AGAM|nr:Transmembrane protein [Ceratobasidium theobromae]